MNETMNNFQEMDSDIKKLLSDIDNVKATIDLFGTIVDEQIVLTSV